MAHDTAEFDWWSGAYAEAGYAVLRPNYRGSTGSTSEHRFAGYGEYGGKMVDDVQASASSCASTHSLSRALFFSTWRVVVCATDAFNSR